ncbi:MAG: ShlB/FhaC/HecB family hemolysin secretion/activation protein [Enterobacteriaceae bacterium]
MRFRVFYCSILLLAGNSVAKELSEQSLGDQQQILQQEREKELEQKLSDARPDINLMSDTAKSSKLRFPKESPCFEIHHVELIGTEQLPRWLPLQRIADQGRNHCLGGKGINQLMSDVQNRLISHGYITSRVVAPKQNLHSGVLKLQIIAGKVGEIRYAPGSDTYAQLYSTFPLRKGDLLDLRALEQGMENLQNAPYVQAKAQIVPSQNSGESDIVISREQQKFWRLNTSVDNSGSKSTGLYQGNIGLTLGNVLSLSDMLYMTVGHDLHRHNKDFQSRNYYLYYAVPWGYWSLIASYGFDSYWQKLPRSTYSGETENVTVKLERLLHRNNRQRTSIWYGIQARNSRNFVNDAELSLQRRNTANWKIGLVHRHFIRSSTLSLAGTYQRGTRWFGAEPAPEERRKTATALSKILTYSISWSLPLQIKNEVFAYRLNYQRQMSHTPLTKPEWFSIGGRWTVRGFDGENKLSASDGWYLRNEFSWVLPKARQSFYLGLDYGKVKGHGAQSYRTGRHMAGAVVGLRGNLRQLNYDFFVGWPLSKPDKFKTDDSTIGFQVGWSY